MKTFITLGIMAVTILSTMLFGIKKSDVKQTRDYIILTEEETLLRIKVKEKLTENYECVGGVSVYNNRNGFVVLMQAMVRN